MYRDRLLANEKSMEKFKEEVLQYRNQIKDLNDEKGMLNGEIDRLRGYNFIFVRYSQFYSFFQLKMLYMLKRNLLAYLKETLLYTKNVLESSGIHLEQVKMKNVNIFAAKPMLQKSVLLKKKIRKLLNGPRVCTFLFV